jgi:hypothetical protein
VQGVNNVQKCLITGFSSLTTKLGRCHPNVCTAETGSQLLTATSYSLLAGPKLFCHEQWLFRKPGACGEKSDVRTLLHSVRYTLKVPFVSRGYWSNVKRLTP